MAPCTTPFCQFQMIRSPLLVLPRSTQPKTNTRKPSLLRAALRRVLSCVTLDKHRRPASCPHSCWCYFHRPFLQCAPPKRAVHRLGRGNKPRSAHCPSFLLVPQPPFLISSQLFRFQGGFRLFSFSPEFPPHLSCFFLRFGYFFFTCLLDILRGP